ncbi:ATP-binding protein [Methanocella sp. MCL-LM]|uniref:ATP-binding protein n=1 Tax=Methanocella sp. MCL-LM TaxID=3412035 RepID=UPI003C71ABBD
MSETFELEIPGTPEHLPQVFDFVADVLEKIRVTDPPAYAITLAVDEVVTNVVAYAYRESEGSVRIACAREGNIVTIVVTDEGRPFDPTKMPPPDTSADLDHRTVGGLGIFLAKKAMNSITYERKDGRNVLTMVKDVRASGRSK